MASSAESLASQQVPAASLSPAMRQYQQFKGQYPDYVLFFRMGDFYEMFWEDARLANRVLGVALTSRSRGGLSADDAIPMAGVPFHSVEGYLRRMIAAGHKVALCEQTEDASQAKGLVRREVTRLMTPGTLTDDPLLDASSDNYLAAVAFHVTRRNGFQAALAWVELSTGSFWAFSSAEGHVLDEIARLRPAEVLIPEQASGNIHPIANEIGIIKGTATTARPSWQFTAHHASEEMRRQWGVKTMGGFGFEDDDPAIFATAALLSYLQETQKTELSHLRPVRRHQVEGHLLIDPASWRSLEIDRTVRTGSSEGSLIASIDRTITTMGARLLRRWLRFPLCEREHIVSRQNAIAALLDSTPALRELREALSEVCDVERIVGRLAVGRASPRDLASLGRCLAGMPVLLDKLDALPRCNDVAPELSAQRGFCAEQAKFVTGAIKDDPASHLREGGVIADGFDAELDRLRGLTTDSAKWLAEYQQRLSQETGIANLKVSYNKVFGYYIEVTETHRQKVPAEWTRRQTVKNAERYITEELKKFEDEALHARDRSIALEQILFEKVRQALLPHVTALQEMADEVARVDVLGALAHLAQDRRYCRPEMVDERILKIVDGKHPVLEQQLGSEFVANDSDFADGDSLLLITGPNMAGKSTYIRQVALITLLAQVGSYVPAASATVGITDRLFTRIGASDELHSGQSTFMVEMTETANILNNATARSLVILDEIGRGTSTLDGLSLAWAIAEYIAGELKCRTLFATHYHELTDLSDRFAGVRNANVAVREWEDQVVFLHRIVEGGTDRSYGIHVARLAGVPKDVLKRARQLLGELAVQHVGSVGRRSNTPPPAEQLPLFEDGSAKAMRELKQLDLNTLTPMQAFELLRQWREGMDE